MSLRIALASLPYPATRDRAVSLACDAVAEAGARGAEIICFPESFVPGYRRTNAPMPPPDAAFLERAWDAVAEACRRAEVAAILGTERLVAGALRITALVIGPDGTRLGFQDKVQLDPSEDARFAPGEGRQVFRVGPLVFGVVICHEGFRYPETVRQVARLGAQVVFHQVFDLGTPDSPRPKTYADPANSFHEKAVLCRAAENTCYVATANHPSPVITSAVASPDGSLLAHQPYCEAGLLIADVSLDAATGRLASRLRTFST